MFRIVAIACVTCSMTLGVIRPLAAQSELTAEQVTVLETDWRFKLDTTGGEETVAYDDSQWRTTRVPHMGHELSNEPPRSTKSLWLRRKMPLPKLDQGQRVLLQVTDATGIQCWLNGRTIATAQPNPSTLLADVTSLAATGENLLVLRTAVPGVQGFIRLHVLPPLHLDGRGLMIDIPDWTGGPAKVRIRTEIVNHTAAEKTVELRAVVIDPDGKTLATSSSPPSALAAGQSRLVTLSSSPISDVPLWSPESPRLCRTAVELMLDGKVVSRRESTFGFRWYRFEPEGPFTLNGKRYPVRGVVYVRPRVDRFSDRKSLWEYEVGLLKGMGVNFIRATDHVDQTFYDVCDREGLVVTAPTPRPNPSEPSETDIANTAREFYNHPSLVAWHTNGEGKDAPIARAISRTARLFRTHDPLRAVLCCELGWRTPGTVGLVDVDIAGQGNYTGWYEGTLDHIGPYMDDYRLLLRERYGRPLPILVSNFGASGDSELHTETPIRNDYSHEYLTAFHQRFYAEIERRPWLAGGFIFCFRDLQTEQPIPRHTWKGMLDLADRKKDAYFFYQSRWTTRPMVHIAQASWTSRELWPPAVARQVEVFSNVGPLELFHDGKSLGTKSEQDNRFVWDVVFREGPNTLRVVGSSAAGRVEDTSTFTVRFKPASVEPRLVTPSNTGGAARPQLTWNEIAGVDRYSVYAGAQPDFDIPQGKQIASLAGHSLTLEPGSEQRFYKVVAHADAVAGRPSYAVGRQPGSVQWRFMNSGWLLSSPTIADLTGDGQPEIVFGSYNGFVYALRIDGSLLWSFSATDPVLASPAVAVLAPGETPSVVVNSAKALYVLSSEGSLKWRQADIRQFDRSVRSPSLADLDADRKLEIIVGSDTGVLKVFHADGQLSWQFSTAGKGNLGLSPTTCVIVDLPATQGKALCFAADDGCVYLVDAKGKEIWKHDTHIGDRAVGLPPNDSTPAAGPLHDPGPTTIISGRGSLKAFDTAGNLLWERTDRSGFPQISNLFRDGHQQVVLASARTLHVLDHRGRDVWSYTLPHPRDYFLQPPTCADLDADGEPDLVAGTRAAKLLAISSRGKLMWMYTSTDELTGVPAVADINQDGIVDVVFGSRDGSLSVLSAGRAPPFAQESRTYRANIARTATYGPGLTSTFSPIESPAIAQRHEDVPYGADPRQKMDAYLPKANRPTPVLIEFHGGGWRRGHKRQNSSYQGLLERALAAGVAVVSANYRLTPRDVFPAQAEDATRVVQFVRSQADQWNIDPQRVVLIGGSAGAHLSLWVGLHDEMADPQSSDLVKRQSTRVRGIIDCWGPTDLARMELRGRAAEALPQFFGCTVAEWDSQRIQALVREASPLSFVSENDPPVLIIHTPDDDARLADDPSAKTSNAHSTLFGVLLQRKMQAAGCRAEMLVEPPNAKQPEWVNRAFAFLQEAFR